MCLCISVCPCVSVSILKSQDMLGHLRLSPWSCRPSPAPEEWVVLAWQAVAGLGPAVVKFPRLDFPRSTRSNHTQAIFPLPSHPDQEARLSQTCAALPKQTCIYTIISQHDWSVEEAGGSFPQKIPASCKRFWLTWSLTYYFLRACLSCTVLEIIQLFFIACKSEVSFQK